MRRFGWALVLVLFLTMAGWAQHEHRAVPQTAAWQSLQTLIGKWDSHGTYEGKPLTGHLEIRMTGGGSALMHWMDPGTNYEMITMFHPDIDTLIATHYCAAHNQPRMKLTSATPQRVVFEFMDGTNIGPHDGHMVGVAIVFLDKDHHDEEWSYEEDGKRSTTTFHYTRASAN